MNHTTIKSIRKGRAGIALIVTLFMVVMMTVLVVAYVSTMSIEAGASASVENAQRTKMIAQGAISHAVNILRTNIPEPAPIDQAVAPFNLEQAGISGTGSRPSEWKPNSAPVTKAENWVVNPGRLTVIDESGQQRYVPLHTGAATRDPSDEVTRDAETVDLNEPLPGEKDPPIAVAFDDSVNPDSGKKRPKMHVRWVPVFENPEEASSAENKMTGRYAFWMDDESAKINFNVALGKPEKSEDPEFHDMLDMGMMTPFFYRGDSSTSAGGASRRPWSLGHPRSINLDVLVEKSSQIDYDKLLAHSWLHGFSRYPEAILDFINVPNPEKWLNNQRFNLSFYSRSPEFNPFGKSRLFTTNYPLSLEAGPLYQNPFMVNPDGDRILHLHSLMGSFGFTKNVPDPDGGGNVLAGNIVNRAQIEMLMRYMHRKWPGYGTSFIDKYGEKECYQIAINLLLMARMATTDMGTNVNGFSNAWALRTTSVNYSPNQQEMQGKVPERMYWRMKVGGQEVLMLPQVPPPYITEVRVIFEQEPAPNGAGYYVNYRYETEYYVPNFGPVVTGERFPTRVDYLKLDASGAGAAANQEFGARDQKDQHASKNWNHANSLGKLYAKVNGLLGPANAELNGQPIMSRAIASSAAYPLGKQLRRIPPNKNQTVVFGKGGGGSVNIKMKIRLGMGVQPNLNNANSGRARPRQMIPLGETANETLEAEGTLDLLSGDPLEFAWEISDPRLSGDKMMWKRDTDDSDGQIGTPGSLNNGEPNDSSPQKSKMKYIQRGPSAMKLGGHRFDRADEYNSRSRTSSKGYWSVIHTGMQSGAEWRTIDLRNESSQASPPDWLLLELLGATYPMQHDNWKIDKALPDEFSTISFMNSTAGQINVNSRIYPHNDWFEAPVRRKPLEAVFKHLRSEADVETLVDGIVDYQTDGEIFDYIGEIANVDSYATGDQFRSESPLRNMAGCLTTKSNTFGLWGVAQTVKKRRSNEKFDEFEAGDLVLGEKRFFAVIERYIWPGKDGVPGNAHIGSGGRWDRHAEPLSIFSADEKTTDRLFELPGSPPLKRAGANQNGARLVLNLDGSYPEYDGPQAVGMDFFAKTALGGIRYQESTLEDAYNPPQPVVKYRIAYFKYLDK
jgi:hypothetical protein